MSFPKRPDSDQDPADDGDVDEAGGGVKGWLLAGVVFVGVLAVTWVLFDVWLGFWFARGWATGAAVVILTAYICHGLWQEYRK